jgi:hypothetical protein
MDVAMDVVRRLPCVGLCLLGLVSGCVVPGEIEAEPAPVNRAPFFRPQSVVPAFEQETRYDPEVTLGPLRFEVPGIRELDEEDRIFWRWFVNYDRRFFSQVFAQTPFGRLPGPDGLSITFDLDPCVDLAPFAPRTLHRVELIVADRQFEEDTPETVFRNQTLPEVAHQFRIVWFVEVDLSKCELVQ